MAVNVTLQYTEQEFADGISEKLAKGSSIPTLAYYLALFLCLLLVDLFYSSWLALWLNILLLSLSTVAFLVSIFIRPLTLSLVRRTKLKQQFEIKIDEHGVTRRSQRGQIFWSWNEIKTVEVYDKNIIFERRKKALLLPLARLSPAQLAELLNLIGKQGKSSHSLNRVA